MTAIPGLWQQLRQDNRDVNIASNRLGSIGRTLFVFPDGNGPRGSATFGTMADAFANLRSRDVIILGGVLREQVVAPLDIYDVSIIGAANLPRQATSGGVPTGGGACWLAPTSPVAATPLLELRAQGWSLSNIEMTPVNASAAVRLTRSAVVDTIDAGHAIFENMFFGGNGGTTQNGIEDNGGCRSVQVLNCRFEGLGNTALLSLNTAAAVPQDWLVLQSYFRGNLNDIKMSLNFSKILWNSFLTAGSGATNKVVQTNFIAVQGNNNHVNHNGFTNTAAQIANASGYNGGNADMWADNFCTDAVDYGIPA